MREYILRVVYPSLSSEVHVFKIKSGRLHLDMRYISSPDISGARWENPGGGWFSPGSDVDQGRVGSESDQQTGRLNSRNWLLAFSEGGPVWCHPQQHQIVESM